jgi:electron transfer flavoprotein alpha subunit
MSSLRLSRGILSSFQSSSKRSIISSSRKASTLVIAEHEGGNLSSSTLATVTAATKIGHPISVLVAGKDIASVADQVSKVNGIAKVITVESATLEHKMAEDMSNCVFSFLKENTFSHVLAPSSNNGKNYLPRAAAIMDCSPLSDIMNVVDHETFVRPMYAGNAIATVKMSDSVKFLLVRTTSFDKATEGSAPVPIEAFAMGDDKIAANMSKFINASQVKSERPDLTSSRVVISGGRGMKNGENFGMLETLADKLGGAVGASRAAVDAGFVPNELQIGQTGKIVAPELYVAVGISGAIQHLTGMKDSKTIVAINKDKDAPIFQVADYGLVDDLFKAIPEINEKL